jgi:hypothetical protein
MVITYYADRDMCAHFHTHATRQRKAKKADDWLIAGPVAYTLTPIILAVSVSVVWRDYPSQNDVAYQVAEELRLRAQLT